MSTRLETFMRASDGKLRPAWLARESGFSRQFLFQLRRGRLEPTRPTMIRIVDAASRLLKRPVYTVELFVLSETDEAFAAMLGVEVE